MELGREVGTVWNALTIRFRMQTVARAFLRYHGFRVADDAPVFVWPGSAGQSAHTTYRFYFHVEIHVSESLMREEDGVAPAERELVLVEQALAWVLWTLALDGDQVGLRRPAFG